MIRIIPVIDIMKGIVVHAIEGKREQYRPLSQSLISKTYLPYDVLCSFKNLGFKEVYIADLDSILSKGSNRKILPEARKLGFKVLLDIGRLGLAMKDFDETLFVIGTEYLKPSEFNIVNERVLSLDMISDYVLFKDSKKELVDVLKELKKIHVRKLLIINLDRVGTFRGPNLKVARIVRKHYDSELIVGGGVRNVEDVLALKDIGINGVLVASAIHKGTIVKPYY